MVAPRSKRSVSHGADAVPGCRGRMRVLLLGASGMLGADLADTIPRYVELHRRSHVELDITRYEAVKSALDRVRPEVVVNAAAYTAVDRAESDRETAQAINARAVGMLGALCAERRTRVLHFSTDYVF